MKNSGNTEIDVQLEGTFSDPIVAPVHLGNTPSITSAFWFMTQSPVFFSFLRASVSPCEVEKTLGMVSTLVLKSHTK